MAMRFVMSLLSLACVYGGSRAEDLQALMQRCAPQVHPQTLSAIVHAESRGRAFVISDDGPAGQPWSVRKFMLRSFDPGSKEEAAKLAESLISQGHLVGLGLTQISSQHLKRFKASVHDALDPCSNLSMGGKVLAEFYVSAYRKYRDPQKALLAAISANNTGSFENGFGNGYVGKVMAASQYGVPQIKYGRVVNVREERKVNSVAGKSQPVRKGNAADRTEAAKMAKIEVESF